MATIVFPTSAVPIPGFQAVDTSVAPSVETQNSLWNTDGNVSQIVVGEDQCYIGTRTAENNADVSVGADGHYIIYPDAQVTEAQVLTFTYRFYDLSDKTWGIPANVTVTVSGVVAGPPTLVSPIPDQNVDTNDVINLDVSANFAGQTSYVAAPLPTGVSFNGTSGVFTGTATTPGTVNTTVTAENSEGSIPDTFAWNITAVATPPVLIQPIPDAVLVNGAFRSADMNDYFSGATSYSSTALPPTFTLVGSVISGTYTGGDANGSITITATNAQGSTPDTFLWTGYAASPVPAGASLNDAILIITGGPTVNDGLKKFYDENSAGQAATLPGLELQFLGARGYTTGTVNDRWMAYLASKGHLGSINDRQLQWWRLGAPL